MTTLHWWRRLCNWWRKNHIHGSRVNPITIDNFTTSKSSVSDTQLVRWNRMVWPNQKPSVTYDYRCPSWGHHVSILTILPNNCVRACGWGSGIKIGDYLLLPNKDGDTRYRVGDDLRYELDPKDQWFATLEFAPRTIEEIAAHG